MGKGRTGSGVEPLKETIRISFQWENERCRETLALRPTPANLIAAQKLRDEIVRKIEFGMFVYADYFPESARAKKQTDGTLGALGDLWLKGHGRLASATKRQYSNALKFWYDKLGGRSASARGVRHSALSAIIGGHEWPSGKLCNNYLIPLRGLFDLARRDRYVIDDPMVGIENSPLQEPLPDPFTLEESIAIVDYMLKHYHPQVGNYFEYAFFAGQRPEEEIAQRWDDIDWHSGSARVERARTFRGEIRPVKGYRARDLELTQRAIAVLKRQKEFTFMKDGDTGQRHGFIFENVVTGRPWHDERSQRDHYWKPALKQLGIRYRRPYCTRHTFATLAIMGGVNITWVARQMGNSPAIIQKHYAVWIDRADKSREKNRLDAAFVHALSTDVTSKKQNVDDSSSYIHQIGRRDWTRTKP